MGERKACEACGAALVGALTLSGKIAPIEVIPSPDGNVWLGLGPWRVPSPDGPLDVAGPGPHPVATADGVITDVHATREVRSMVLSGPILEKAREQGMSVHRNHFASCPDAERFRRGS